MVRKLSRTGAWLKRGMVSVGGVNAGLGAGFTSGFLIAGSGSCAEGAGTCCVGAGFSMGCARLVSGGGGGFWGTTCGFGVTTGGFCEVEFCPALAVACASCKKASARHRSTEVVRAAATSQEATINLSTSSLLRAERTISFQLPRPERSKQDTLFSAEDNRNQWFVTKSEQGRTAPLTMQARRIEAGWEEQFG